MEDRDLNITDELIQTVSELPPIDDDGQPIEAMLTKFVLVAEWMDSTGERWLTKSGVSGHGDKITEWDQKGLFHEALFGDW